MKLYKTHDAAQLCGAHSTLLEISKELVDLLRLHAILHCAQRRVTVLSQLITARHHTGYSTTCASAVAFKIQRMKTATDRRMPHALEYIRTYPGHLLSHRCSWYSTRQQLCVDRTASTLLGANR
jgi:hypothetical protein